METPKRVKVRYAHRACLIVSTRGWSTSCSCGIEAPWYADKDRADEWTNEHADVRIDGEEW